MATFGVTSTSSYENPTGGDDCITQTTFHTPLCSQPYDAIFQYSRGTLKYSIITLFYKNKLRNFCISR